MSVFTPKMRAEMAAINAGISHSRRGPATAKYLRYVDGEPVWSEDPAPVQKRSMFPYKSTAMCVAPEEIPIAMEILRAEAEGPAKYTEFTEDGCPIITSAAQQSDLAKALGMKTGRDGYGHTDEYGRFQNSGRRRADEVATGRAKVRKAIETLNVMPEESPAGAVADVLREYDIMPNEANTG